MIFVVLQELFSKFDYRGDYMWIYTPYITRKGKRIYAKSYGLKVFRFWVDKDKKKPVK